MSMKSVFPAGLLLSVFVVAGCGGPSQAGSPSESSTEKSTEGAAGGASVVEKWRISEGFAQPESTYYHEATDSIFVSNVNGTPTEKDGNGYISKITTDGKMVEAKWVTGLDAPKGMRSHGNTLWVTDIDQLVAIDIKTGKIAQRVPVAGSTFLNDLATADDGTVYAADTIGNKIFRYQDGKVSAFGEGVELESPNGLLVDGDRLIVGAWGLDPDESFVTKTPGHLYWLDRKSGEKHLITKEPTGNLDGVELDGKGGFFVTDFRKGVILHIDEKGQTTEVKSLGGMGAADHAFLIAKRLLVQPQMMESYVAGFQVGE